MTSLSITFDQYVFGDVMERVFNELENSGLAVDNNCGMIWDNLSVHKTPHVINIVEGRPSNNHFWSMDYPLYHPKLAPIEYVFCELECKLSKRCHREGRNWTIVDLEREIRDHINYRAEWIIPKNILSLWISILILQIKDHFYG